MRFNVESEQFVLHSIKKNGSGFDIDGCVYLDVNGKRFEIDVTEKSVKPENN